MVGPSLDRFALLAAVFGIRVTPGAVGRGL